MYNPVNWADTRIQHEGDTCAFVDLLHGTPKPSPQCMTWYLSELASKRSSVEVNSALSPGMRVP